jgi:two-component system, chemotaxis family, protein-glutamate methylesterase/glutaminase
LRVPVRVLVADDSAFIRRAVERMLGGDPSIQVVGAATNGVEAVEMARTLAPDVVLMDVNMPEMDGMQALERIMAETPTRVILMSTLTRSGAEITLRALEMGAVDFIDKTMAGGAMDIYTLAPIVREKVLVAVRARPKGAASADTPDAGAAHAARPVPEPTRAGGVAAVAADAQAATYEVVVVGCSTGGPRALSLLIGALPSDFPVGIVVAQHMPSGFTQTLAERLDRESPLAVCEARDGDLVAPGRVLIAPGGEQISLMRARGLLRVGVGPGDPALLHRPCVDVLFASAAEVSGARGIGVILTGMGHDGAAGLARMRAAGARTIVESEETALIDGMPRSARGSAEVSLRLDAIAAHLVRLSDSPAPRPEAY